MIKTWTKGRFDQTEKVNIWNLLSHEICFCWSISHSLSIYHCLSDCLLVYLSIFLSVLLYVYLLIYLSKIMSFALLWDLFFLSMSYTLCLNLSLSSYMSVGLSVGLLVCSCLNFALLKDLLLSVNFALSVLIYHGLSDYMLIFLFVCLMVCLYIWLYVSLSLFMKFTSVWILLLSVNVKVHLSKEKKKGCRANSTSWQSLQWKLQWKLWVL